MMAKARILVVEDVRFVARDIQDFLEGLGYCVPGLMATGEDAIRAVEELRPDLVLMDIGLKGEMDGIEAARRIRANSNVPVIYLTGQGDDATVQRAKLTEPFGYLRKPLNEKDLPVAIEMALHKHQIEDKLRVSNFDLERFGYVVSHDLQSPLGNIGIFVKKLIAHLQDHMDPKAQDYVTRIKGNIARMKRLITDLLEYSRVAYSDKPFSAINASDAMHLACANLQSLIEECGSEVVITTPLPKVMADETQLVQLFQNLVGNALKFRQPDTASRINIVAESKGPVCEFCVSDNGIGIEHQYLRQIFGLHERLHSVTMGHGIGLATCERIVKRHGGAIWAESEGLNHGTCFRFTLPSVCQPCDPFSTI
jgi:two-component system sensor histidine kinase/response regulator